MVLMVQWNMECVLNLVSGDLNLVSVILTRVWFGGLSAGGVSTPKPNFTVDGDQPLSPNSDRSKVTELHQIEFGTGFGDQFTYVTYAPEPDDTGDGD